VAEKFPLVQKATTTDLNEYTLVAIPAGRSGVKGYQAKIRDIMVIVTKFNAILQDSEKIHGLQGNTTRVSKKEKVAAEVLF
jgi:hypothetical protein